MSPTYGGVTVGRTGQTQAKWLPSLPAAYRMPLESLPVSVLQDIQAMAVTAQVGHMDALGPTLECLGWPARLLSNLYLLPVSHNFYP